jgi:hypothetical protein
MDKKLHEDLNRIRKLSGLVEDDTTWTERLPDGTVRTHRYGYSDEKPGIPAWDEYKDLRMGGPWGKGSGIDLDGGRGNGRGQTGPERGAGAPGPGQGAGQQGNGPGMGTSNGLGGRGNGLGQGNSGEIQRIPSGGNGVGSPGGGSGTTIQRISPSNGDTGYSDGRTSGQPTTTYSPGYSTSTYPDDSDVEKPLSPRELAKQRAAERAAEVEQRKQDALDRAQAAKDKAQQDALDRNYVNPAWEKEQERLKQQQATPVQPAPEPPKAVAPPTSFQRPSIAKDLILPPLDEPKVAPSTSFKRPELKPTPEPAKEPTPAPATFKRPELKTTSIPEPVKEPTPEPAKEPTPAPATFKRPELKTTSIPEPVKGPTPEPNKSVELPTTFKRPPLKVEPAPSPQPVAAPSNQEHPNTTITNAPQKVDPTSGKIVIPPVLTTKEPSTWDVPAPGEYIPHSDQYLDSPSATSEPAPPIDIPVTPKDFHPTVGPDLPPKKEPENDKDSDYIEVELVPGEYHNVSPKPSTTGKVSVAPLVQKEPGVAQQILLPPEKPSVELMPMSKDDADKAFGPMPGQSSSSTPNKSGQTSAGSGSAGQSASGATGDSGEKGGAKSSSDPWARPLIQKPWETPRGKFQDPGMIGAPDFKGTLTNPGTLPNTIPGMPNTDLTGKVNATPNPTPAGSGGKGDTLQTGDEPSTTNYDARPLTITRGTSKPRSVEAQDRAAEMQRVSDETEKSSNKPNEGMERMLQLAGIKESTRVERQFLQESKVTKNTITDTIKRLAGLK